MKNEKYFLLLTEKNFGNINIHYTLLESMVIDVVSRIEGVSKVYKNNMQIINNPDNQKKGMNIYVDVNIELNTNVVDIAENIQENIKYSIESLTNLIVNETIIKVVNIDEKP